LDYNGSAHRTCGHGEGGVEVEPNDQTMRYILSDDSPLSRQRKCVVRVKAGTVSIPL